MTLIGDLQAIDDFLHANAPVTHATLRPGLSADAVETLGQGYGFPLMPELATLLRWHDGCTLTGDAFQLWTDYAFLHSAQMLAEHDEAGQTRRRTRWNDHWVPIASDFGGAHIVVDHSGATPTHTVFLVALVDGRDTRYQWPSVTDLVAEVSTALRHETRLNDRVPVCRDGRLMWAERR